MMKESPVAAAAESTLAPQTSADGINSGSTEAPENSNDSAQPQKTRADSAQSPENSTDSAQPQKTRADSAQTSTAANAEAFDVIAEIEKVMAAIRPAVQADKGDVELVSFDAETGIVEVELQGACQSCPASSATLKSGIERIMKDRVPSVTEVVNVGQVFYSDGTAVTL